MAACRDRTKEKPAGRGTCRLQRARAKGGGGLPGAFATDVAWDCFRSSCCPQAGLLARARLAGASGIDGFEREAATDQLGNRLGGLHALTQTFLASSNETLGRFLDQLHAL